MVNIKNQLLKFLYIFSFATAVKYRLKHKKSAQMSHQNSSPIYKLINYKDSKIYELYN